LQNLYLSRKLLKIQFNLIPLLIRNICIKNIDSYIELTLIYCFIWKFRPLPISLSQGKGLGVCSKEMIRYYSLPITYLRNLRSKKMYRIPSEKPRIFTFFRRTYCSPTRPPSWPSLLLPNRHFFLLFSKINFYLSELFRRRKKVPFCFSELT